MGSRAADRDDRRTWALEQLGRKLADRYRLEELRGIGGMGAVYVARHLHVGSTVAIKLILPGHSKGTDLRAEALRTEAQRAASVGGPGVVQVTDFDFDENGHAFLVMELLDGETLGERIEREGSVAPSEAVHLVRAVLDVLGRVHEKGLVHGDLKPSNLFVCAEPSGSVKVLDFGIASAFGQSETEAASGVRGTPAFMAPEQLEGQRTPGADVYAMGAVLYHALSGRRPYEGLSGADVLTELRAGPPHSLGALRPGLAPSLVRAVERAMARDVGSRFDDAEAFREALANFERPVRTTADDNDATLTSPVPLETAGPKVAPAPKKRRTTPTWRYALGALLALLSISALGASFYLWGLDEPAAPAALDSGVVLVPYGERFMFPAVVVDQTGTSTRVVFSDGDIGTVEHSDVRPDRVVPGACLMLRMPGGRGLPGCVIRRYGDALLLQMREGPPRWTSLARLALDRTPPTEGLEPYRSPVPPAPGELGSVVLCNFQGRGAYYPGTVVGRDAHGRLLIVYSDGDSEWVEAAQVRFADIEVGHQVRAAPRRTAVPDADIGDGIVLEREGFAMKLRFSDGREGWVSMANVQVLAANMPD